MPKYDVPIWVTVEAPTQDEAWEIVNNLESLQLLRGDVLVGPTVGEPEECDKHEVTT